MSLVAIKPKLSLSHIFVYLIVGILTTQTSATKNFKLMLMQIENKKACAVVSYLSPDKTTSKAFCYPTESSSIKQWKCFDNKEDCLSKESNFGPKTTNYTGTHHMMVNLVEILQGTSRLCFNNHVKNTSSTEKIGHGYCTPNDNGLPICFKTVQDCLNDQNPFYNNDYIMCMDVVYKDTD